MEILGRRGRSALPKIGNGIFNFFAIFHFLDEFLRRNHLHLKDMHRLEIFHVIVLL
jgi:hypothetical protein